MEKAKDYIVGIIVVLVILGIWGNHQNDSQTNSVWKVSEEQLEEYKNYPCWSKEYLQYYLSTNDFDLQNFNSQLGTLNKKYEPLSDDNYKYVKYNSKILGTDYYSWSKSQEELIYVGDMKENKPNGYGTLLRPCYSKDKSEVIAYQFVYSGEFKSGYYNGFGVEFSYGGDENTVLYNRFWASDNPQDFISLYLNCIEYIGYFEKGERDGKGMAFSYPSTLLEDYLLQGYDMTESEMKEFGSMGVESGTFKKGDENGKFVAYYDDYLIYKGDMKKGKITGTGTQYDANGDVIYSGKWKNGEYAD